MVWKFNAGVFLLAIELISIYDIICFDNVLFSSSLSKYTNSLKHELIPIGIKPLEPVVLIIGVATISQ